MSVPSNIPSTIITGDEVAAVARLRALVSTVPAYQDYRAGICDSSISSLSTLLPLLPVIDKSRLIEWGDAAYAASDSKIMLFSETSGTTSVPLSTPRGQDEFKWNTFNQARAYRRHLQPELDKVAILHPSVMSPFVEISARALQEIGVGYLRLFPIPKICDYARIYRVLENYGITTLMSTPTLIYKLLFELKKCQHGKLPNSLQKLLLTGEYITQNNLSNMDKILGRGVGSARAFVYGSSEVATVMYGARDATYQGYLNDFVFEVIPIKAAWIERLEKPKNAVTGHLLISWLRDGIMPMLRYNTGDIFTVWRDEKSGKWLFRAEGREQDELVTPWFRALVDESVYGTQYPVYHYDAEVSDGKLCITVIAELRDAEEKQQFQIYINDRLHGLDMNVQVRINPDTHPFYEFSPFPKSASFTRT